ncbi:hypothetical protein [Aquimarina aggregata]|uniref:hypothetical protein n=1 Tax=Aquimarina aggregata TaxID=1642818 RepID=UPI0024916FF1|nr:hypothetical protein [Aquimarina aggregata]
MKYHQFYNKDQEAKKHLLADAFGSILGVGLRTSVVNPLPKMISIIHGVKKKKRALLSLCEYSHETIRKSYSTCNKAFIS